MVFRRLLSILVFPAFALALAGVPSARSDPRVLRVVADPNNLPFSNDQLDGFENKIVALVAEELNATVEYTWISKRDGGVASSLRESGCDLATGVAPAAGSDLTTHPYCGGGYVVLTRSDRGLDIRSLDDVTEQNFQIGVTASQSDQAMLASLASRGISDRIHAYPLAGSALPLTPLLDALAKGEIDLGIVPAPLGGYLAKRYGGIFSATALNLADPSAAPLCLAVRAGDPLLRDELNSALVRRHDEIAAILNSYGIASAE